MYLIDDGVSYFMSGWDIDTRGGEIKYLTDPNTFCYSLKNKNGKFPLMMKRTLTKCENGDFVFETALEQNVDREGFSISFCDEKDIDFLNIKMNAQGMYLNDTYLVEFKSNCVFRIKLNFSFNRKEASVLVDGKRCAKVDFLPSAIKYIKITAPNVKDSEARIYFMRLYSGFDINEEFAIYKENSMSLDGWETDGDMYIEKRIGISRPFNHCLHMKSGAKLSTSLPMHKRSVVEFMTFSDNFTALIGDINICASSKGIFANNEYIGESSIQYWCSYRIEFDTDKAVIKLNNRKRVEIPCSSPGKIGFWTDHDLCLDKIFVYELPAEPTDYVPKPHPIKRDDVHVGMMSCSIWREGSHFGWDKINPYPERKPLNGFYDEGEIEQADWEIKYMCEHGIEYEIFCWFAPRGWVEGPIQDRMNAINKAFLNAKYVDDLKFTFMWENGACKTSIDGFYQNIVPFWIEYYFKNPHFLIIDNKPVIYIYTHWGLKEHFGSVEEVKKAMEYLDTKCKEAGFDGVIVIQSLCQRIKGAFEEVKSMGIDYAFSYTWGTDSKIEQQQAVLTKQFNYDVLDVVPTVTMGYDTKPWLGTANGYLLPTENLTELIKWTRNVHNKRYSSDSIASRMIVLDNFNEYGEGHYFMPSEGYGFTYLDAVLNGLELDNPHEDIYPDDNQKMRICNLYNPNRVQYKTNYIAPKHSKNVVIGWYYDNDADYSMWKPNNGITCFRKADNAILGHTEKDGYFEVQLNKPININNASNLCVRLKLTNHTFDQFRVMFTTEEEPSYCEKNSVVGYAYESFARAWILPIGKCPGWQGSVTGFRLIPNTSGGDFELVSFEVLENEHILPRIFVNEKSVRLTYAEDGMIALSSDIISALNAAMLVNDNGSVIIHSNTGKKIVLSADSYSAVLEDEKINISRCCKIKDRFFLIDVFEILGYLGYNVECNDGIITVNY